MRIDFSFEMTSPEQIRKKIDNKISILLWLAMNKMRELAKLKCPVDTARLRDSIILYPDIPGAREYILSTGTDYGVDVEYGTDPHYVPINALKGWSKRVLKDETAAYWVQNKIAEEGTTAQPFMRPAFHEVRYSWLPAKASEILG